MNFTFHILCTNYDCLLLGLMFCQVNWKKMPKSAGENYLALTGSLPDLSSWSATLPNELILSVNEWRTCCN